MNIVILFQQCQTFWIIIIHVCCAKIPYANVTAAGNKEQPKRNTRNTKICWVSSQSVRFLLIFFKQSMYIGHNSWTCSKKANLGPIFRGSTEFPGTQFIGSRASLRGIWRQTNFNPCYEQHFGGRVITNQKFVIIPKCNLHRCPQTV